MATVRHIGYFPEGSCIEESDGSEIWPNGAIPDIESFMVGMSLEEAMACYWKVKEWNYYAGNSELGIDVTTGDPEVEDYDPQSEKDLVCGRVGSQAQVTVPPYVNPNGVGETISVFISIFFGGPTPNNSRILFYNGSYYPEFSFFWINQPAAISNIGKITGQDLRFFCEIDADFGGDIAKYRVEVFPKTYWPYNP